MSNSLSPPDDSIAQLQERLAALESENAALKSLAESAPPNSAATLQTEILDLRKQQAQLHEQAQGARLRIAELAQANEVLQASLQKLAEEPELERFLAHILNVCVERFAAVEVGLWRFEEGIFRLFISLEDSVIKLRSEIAHPGAQVEVAKAIRNQEVLDCLRKREIVADYEEDFQTQIVYEQFRDYFPRRGIKSVLKIPMFLDSELRGILVLRFRDRRYFSPEETELAHALANQAVLALELTRLAEAAGQAAIAQKKETIAKAKAQELARINQFLRNSLRYLSSTLKLSDVLGRLLLEIVRHAAAATGHIFLYSAAESTLTLSVRSRDNQVFWTTSKDEPAIFESPIPIDIFPIFTDLCQQPRLVTLQREDFEGRLWPGVALWFQTNSYKSTSCCVLMIGDQPLGLLVMAFSERTALSPTDEEMILTLAHQMAMLIRLTSLADEAKQTALLQERNHLASEIHDTLAQAFTGISIQLGVAKRIAEDDPSEVMRIIDRVMELANAALSQARGSVWALHPTAEEFANLDMKLSQYAEQMTQSTPVQFQMEIVGRPRPLSPLIGKNLLRIGQEAITNTLKHANASHLRIELVYAVQWVELCVRDNGCGFLLPSNTGGFGLISLSERADRIGGHFTLRSEPGQGTEVCIQVPVESP